MAVTRCDLATVRGRYIAAVNAATAGAWTTTVGSADDLRRNTTEIINIILGADARICAARAARVGDGYRSLFLGDSGSIAHGGVIPDCLGPPEQFVIKQASSDPDYKAGKFDDSLTLADIERWRSNTGGRYGAAHNAAGSVLSGFYIRRGKLLFYTGADAKCQIATFIRTPICQAPESDETMLLGLSLGDGLKEGDTGPMLATIIADARAEYASLVQRIEPNPSETVVLAA